MEEEIKMSDYINHKNFISIKEDDVMYTITMYAEREIRHDIFEGLHNRIYPTEFYTVSFSK